MHTIISGRQLDGVRVGSSVLVPDGDWYSSVSIGGCSTFPINKTIWYGIRRFVFAIEKTTKKDIISRQLVGHIKIQEKNRNNNAIQNIATHRKNKTNQVIQTSKHKQTKRRWVQQIHLPPQV